MKNLLIQFHPQEAPRLISIKRFEELFELHYLEKLQFENWEVEQWIYRQCERAQRRQKVGKLALWLGTLHGPQIERGDIPDVTIRWIGEKIGYGVFANRLLKKWEFIGEYTGLVKQRKLFFRNINDYCFMYPRAWIALKSLTIDSAKYGNFTRFINHSDLPNCESISVFHRGLFHIMFRAIRDIPAGQELTYDYGSIYWSRRKKLSDPPEELINLEDLKRLTT
jgi:hypothetical protein